MIVLYSVELSARDRCHWSWVWSVCIICAAPDTWHGPGPWYHHTITITVQTRHTFLGPPMTHSALLLWRRSGPGGSFVKIDFVPQHKRCLISIRWKFCVGQSRILPFPHHLMMALNIYLYKLMITNEPFCPVCLPDPDTSLSFFVGTLQKYTVTEHWQKQQNILPRQKILGSPHKTNCDQMTQKSPKTPICGSVPITSAPVAVGEGTATCN